MGYRGEDRSPERAAWGAQSPRQPSREHAGYDDPGYGSADYGAAGYDGAGYDRPAGYDGAGYGGTGHEGASYANGGYDTGAPDNHAQDPYGSGWYQTDHYGSGSYPTAGYDSHPSGGYPASGQQARDYGADSTATYNAAPTYDSYHGTSYGEVSYDSGASYDTGASYDSGASYDTGPSYDTGSYNSADYNSADYSNGADYNRADYSNTAGYDTSSYETSSYDTGGYDTGAYRSRHSSGAYPVVEPEPRDDGNDWYARSGPIPASGFADTSAQPALQEPARDPVRGYPPEPDPLSPGLAVTTQQPRYDENKYVSYPGYDAVDESPRGYDDYDDYGSETRLDQAPIDYAGPTGGRGYGQALQGDEFDGSYHGSPAEPDEDVMASPAGPTRKGKAKKKAPASRPPRRSRRVFVLSAVGVILVAAIAGGYEYWNSTKADRTAEQEASAPLPSSAPASGTQQCVQQSGSTYCHIESRTDDPTALTLSELYQPAVFDESNKTQFLLVADKLDKSCSNAVVGSELISQLKTGECDQVLRASYVTDSNTVMGTIGVINLNTTNQAHYAGRIIGANDFIMPLASSKGVTKSLGKGTGVVEAEYKGHYLILTWAEFTNLKTPSTSAQTQQLEDFENSLVASTANVYLSQLMVNGDSTSATPSASASSSASKK